MQLIKSFILAPKQEYNRHEAQFIQRFMKILEEELIVQHSNKQSIQRENCNNKIPSIVNHRLRSYSTNVQSTSKLNDQLHISQIEKTKKSKIELLPKLSIRQFEFKDIEKPYRKRKLIQSKKNIKQ
ncbi:unnamed protein product (macronuclear) [Paramecium tetraurelia]|uniref:Uncharacterized protein n=1 Tax=Paramecium tetraurelia TaxID=5888 RepID=A0DK48_PARTE|nr:uncharacterized protein GSPATT00017744001 [Paramecium tetraurelia]CAK83415.1 unnamed protein product [Paramecium tetraurelia]|eukprot:XP_001450812.1 hypothetical protein (macronuclear) [Paramecium tetraurelia strain d4-2]